MKGESIKGSWHTAYGYKFLSSDDMELGQEFTLTISGVTREMAYDSKSKQEKPLISVSFAQTDKLLALNATNAKSISEIAGSPMVEKWQGKRITIYVIKDKFFGKLQTALRVKVPESVSESSEATAS